jgi:rhomboid protease GluP
MQEPQKITLNPRDPGPCPRRASPGQFRPKATWAVIAVMVVVFLGINGAVRPDSWETLGKWGAASPEAFWRGAYWSLLCSAAVHQALWHLAFNLYWLAVLGSRLEQAIGVMRYLALLGSAAIISAGWQVAVSETTGIGASGVVYAMFGFMLVVRHRYPAFQDVMTAQTIQLFLLWLVGCMIATYAKIWSVGNAAHLSGMLFGMAIGGLALQRRRLLLVPALVALVVGAVLPAFWCPWSATWLGVQAVRAYERKDHAQAIAYYSQLIAKDPGAAWAYHNRGVSYMASGDFDKAQADFAEASRLNPTSAVREEQRPQVDKSQGSDDGPNAR